MVRSNLIVLKAKRNCFYTLIFLFVIEKIKKCSQKVATKPELLVAKDEMLVANATLSVTISNPVC